MTISMIIQILTIAGMIVSIMFFIARIGELKGQYEERHKNHCQAIARAHDKIEELEKRQNDQSGIIAKIESGIEYIIKSIDELKRNKND